MGNKNIENSILFRKIFQDDIIFEYTGYIRSNIWDVFVKIWSELGMKPIKFEQFIPNIIGASLGGAVKEPYNVMEFTRSQPLFKKIVTFDIFIKLLSLIHEKDIRTAAEFFQHAPEIYKFLFENKNLWGRITTNTLCDEYFETYAYLTVGVIYNKNKIKQLFAKPLAKKRRNVQL